MIQATTRLVLLAMAFALGTVMLGWWAVPVIAFLWGLIGRSRPAGVGTALAAGLGWGGLLVWTGIEGPIGRLANQVGAIMGIPGWGLVVATLLLPMMLAGAAAMLGPGIRGQREEGKAIREAGSGKREA